ncbi:MAG: ATP-dependent DNA helicase, partial [Candidatus Ornithospirochaeta sp.]
MANLVEEAFSSSLPAVVEAGTGIGKSFAYLVPSFLLLSEDPDARVVVATSTIPLQKQLFDKDIPFLEDALAASPSVSILYGRGNYLCLRKFKAVDSESSLISTDPDSSEGRLKRWVESTETGSRSDISDSRVAYMVRELLSDEDDCLGSSCPDYESCFFYKARRNAQKARLIITNHHIVLADAQIRWENNEDFSEPAILPGYTHLVVDEAHHIENEATESFSDKYSLSSVSFYVDSLKRRMSRYQNMSLMEFLSPYEKEDRRGQGKTIAKELDALMGEAEGYDLVLKEVLSVFYDRRSMLFTPEFYSSFGARIRVGEALADSMKSIGTRIVDLYSGEVEEAKQYIDRARRYGNGLIYLSDVLRTWIRFDNWDGEIPYAVDDADGSPVINIAPMAVGPMLKDRLVTKLESILYCSATLSVGGSFSYFFERSGLEDEEKVLQGIYPSPFDFKRNLMYLIPQDAKDWKNKDSSYIEYSVDIISRSILASGGGALVLFTSIAMMNEVYRKVEERIGKHQELLLQDSRTSRHVLLSRFKKNEDSSLFATSSFWEGIDAPGNTLRLVIIVKLPFEVPSDPINLARSRFIDSHSEKGSFMTLTVPNAVIKMKQGVGRLIRSEDDKGIVMIL